uniref:procollagen-proline 4-dioxygenase n=1 Tax=Cacopsylla melanoneura TaxID=428564 RepID=A0A8D8ZSS4_9HEMI
MAVPASSHHSVLNPFLLFLLISSVCLDTASSQTYFTSVQKLEHLLRNEIQVIDAMRTTVKDMRKFLDEIKLFLQELKEDHNAAKQEVSEGNPIAIYKMMKRMSVDVRNFIPEVNIFRTNPNIIPRSAVTNDDLVGTVKGILRIADVYEYPLEDIILNGKLGNYETKAKLSVDEIQVFYLTALFGGTNPFRKDLEPAMIVDIFDFGLFESLLGKSFDLESSNKVLYDEPHLIVYYKRLILPFIQFGENFNIEHFGSLLRARFSKFAKTTEMDLKPLQEYVQEQNRSFVNAQQFNDIFIPYSHRNVSIYRTACQGNLPVPEKIKSSLKCYYESYRNPYLKIGPFKMEELYLDPKIIKIHDAIADGEIEELVGFSKEKITRGRVFKTPDESIYSDTRLSNIFFMNYQLPEYQSFASKIVSKIADMTDLVMSEDEIFGENLQTSNYGLGGYYDLHFDSVDRRENGIWRLATLMFYMTDVELGGATIFPSLNLTVFPDKGSAIFWYNSHANTLLDHRMLHSGCPVALGNKWVANQWIREPAQMFARPCVYGELVTDIKDTYLGYWDKLNRAGHHVYFTPNISSQYALM